MVTSPALVIELEHNVTILRSVAVTRVLVDVVLGWYKICIAQSCCYHRVQECVTKRNMCGALSLTQERTKQPDKR